MAALLRERGVQHEADYLARLRAAGATVVDLSSAREAPLDDACALTVEAMRAGADVIVQAPLASPWWFGYADILRRVEKPSALGAWSYEVDDTKLSRETRGGTILQLCAYSELVGTAQERMPDEFRVVTPAATETYRLDELSAFHRFVKAGLLQFASRFVTADRARVEAALYPNPTEHCEICRWRARCTERRRADDHLSFVAGLGRMHQAELEARDIDTLARFWRRAVAAGVQTVARGGGHLRAAAAAGAAAARSSVRAESRSTSCCAIEAGFGLTQLPEPRPGDLFLDLEGDPFGRDAMAIRPGESGREYLFGLGRVDADGVFQYSGRWAFSDVEERAAFDAVMTDIMAALEADSAIHVYHYAPYEPSAFKRLMGRYATRETDLDRLLRGGRFVDSMRSSAARCGPVSSATRSRISSRCSSSPVPLISTMPARPDASWKSPSRRAIQRRSRQICGRRSKPTTATTVDPSWNCSDGWNDSVRPASPPATRFRGRRSNRIIHRSKSAPGKRASKRYGRDCSTAFHRSGPPAATTRRRAICLPISSTGTIARRR